MNSCLLIIDPQKDMMPGGVLNIPGADKDMIRLSNLIKNNISKIDKIFVTLESRNFNNITHRNWWINNEDEHPEDFTSITYDDIKNNIWFSSDPYMSDISCAYLYELERGHDTFLTIYPPHCLIGTEGHNIEHNLMEALITWEKEGNAVEYVFKGHIPEIEYHGAFKSIMPQAIYPTSSFNTKIFENIFSFDRIMVAGESSSHGVPNTIFQMFDHILDYEELKRDLCRKLIYIGDTSSPLPGFEQRAKQSSDKLESRGVTITNTKELEKYIP